MANGNRAAALAAGAGPVMRAEYGCHSFPEATRRRPLRRTPLGQVRGRGSVFSSPDRNSGGSRRKLAGQGKRSASNP